MAGRRLRRAAAAVLVWAAGAGFAARAAAEAGVLVPGPGQEPQLFFACCDQGIAAAQKLLGDPRVIAELQELHAGVAVTLPDYSAERAALVRALNAAGIPAIAGIGAPDAGGYINAGDFSQARAAVAGLEEWSERNGLRWEAVGLDIEPNFAELGRLRGHPWQLTRVLVSRYFERGRVMRARAEYAGLIRQLQESGYRVETVQLPLIVAEREEHSTVLERLLGIVDVRGNQEAVMVYTSFAPADVGAGMIWTLGPDAQAVAVGSTEGPRGLALDWEQFSQDLIVAAHFTHTVGVYNLEGCVEQGFLARLESLDWKQAVVIPASEVAKARRREQMACAAVWLGTWLPGIVAGFVVAAVVLLWFGRRRRKSNRRGEAAGTSEARRL